MSADVLVCFDSVEDANIVANLINKMLNERGINAILNDVEEIEKKQLNKAVSGLVSQGPIQINVDTYDDDEDKGDFWWENYLIEDPEDGMVVKDTLVKVSDIVELIIQGSTWTDILHTHPELTEEDIRACVSYSINQG